MRELFPDSIFVPAAWGTGKRLAIGEAPGETESQTGIPFSGGAGKWFDICLRKAGLRREELTVTNCIQCRPPNNVFPSDPEAKSYISKEDGEAAVRQCVHNHIKPILEERKWERVDLLGEKALRYLTGKAEGIMQWRGSPIEIDTEKL